MLRRKPGLFEGLDVSFLRLMHVSQAVIALVAYQVSHSYFTILSLLSSLLVFIVLANIEPVAFQPSSPVTGTVSKVF